MRAVTFACLLFGLCFEFEREAQAQPDTAASDSAARSNRVEIRGHELDAPSDAEPPSPKPTAATAPEFRLGAGAYLWYYQPIALAGRRNFFELYDAHLDVNGSWGAFGFHLEPHFRDTKLRPYFDGPVWLQQAYGFFEMQALVVKGGKIYTRLGLLWDDSFYGNIQAFDGLKLAPDYGVSLEGTRGDRIGVRYVAQYFVNDGRTNLSFSDRDTVSIPGARRAREAILALEPFVRLDPRTELTLGLSGEYLRAELPSANHDVFRVAVHTTFRHKGGAIWAEVLRQNGQSVTDFPYAATAATATRPAVPGRTSAHNDYLLLGATYTIAPVTLRYNWNLARYEDVSVTEFAHIPAIDCALNQHLKVITEFAIWSRSRPEGSLILDRSLNLTLNAEL